MSILLPGSTAIFLLVKGLLNKFVFLLKNIIRKICHSFTENIGLCFSNKMHAGLCNDKKIYIYLNNVKNEKFDKI